MRATQEPPVLPSRPRLVPAPGSELPGGFSIHAGVRIEGDDREGREQLLRYAARPAFSEVQLSLLEDDVVELELKSPTASGQRVVHLHPVQFLRHLAWLIPPPKQNQVRYYGVFAPTHGLRAEVVPKKVELEVVRGDGDEDDDDAAGDGCEDDARCSTGAPAAPPVTATRGGADQGRSTSAPGAHFRCRRSRGCGTGFRSCTTAAPTRSTTASIRPAAARTTGTSTA
jgi:hypothetical protein